MGKIKPEQIWQKYISNYIFKTFCTYFFLFYSFQTILNHWNKCFIWTYWIIWSWRYFSALNITIFFNFLNYRLKYITKYDYQIFFTNLSQFLILQISAIVILVLKSENFYRFFLLNFNIFFPAELIFYIQFLCFIKIY